MSYVPAFMEYPNPPSVDNLVKLMNGNLKDRISVKLDNTSDSYYCQLLFLEKDWRWGSNSKPTRPMLLDKSYVNFYENKKITWNDDEPNAITFSEVRQLMGNASFKEIKLSQYQLNIIRVIIRTTNVTEGLGNILYSIEKSGVVKDPWEISLLNSMYTQRKQILYASV